MEIDRIRVFITSNASRLYPVDKVKLMGDFDEIGADVIVVYPSFEVTGRISGEDIAKFLSWRLETGGTVINGEPEEEKTETNQEYEARVKKMLGLLKKQ